MAKHKILYSTNAYLSHEIAKKYYKNIHYVWCANYFNPATLPDQMSRNPSTANPYWRYKNLLEETKSPVPDRHGPYIQSTRAGLRLGAEKKLEEKVITVEQRDEILEIIEDAECSQFRPLVYHMVYSEVKKLITYASVEDLANVLSTEIIIAKLPRKYFTIEIYEDSI